MATLKSSKDISAVFANGKRFHLDGLSLIVSENRLGFSRAVFAAGKKLGNAVWRNRAKRRMRSLYRELEPNLAGYDIVFLAKASINEENYANMLSSLQDVVEKEALQR